MGLKPLKRRQKAELKRSRVRSLKSVLLKCESFTKKSRAKFKSFVGLSGGLWRRRVSGGVKQKASAMAVKRLKRELKRKAG